jgi:nucleotide-binding universal stress UspA family protein
MSKILCATRGGEASYRTQDAAIALAKTRAAELVFLFVVDIGFLDKTERAVRPDVVAEEMTHMGEFLLSMAQERAEAEGITAQRRIYRGTVREELAAAAKQEGADTLILGKPADEGSAFSLEALERLADDIEQDSGVKVKVF